MQAIEITHTGNSSVLTLIEREIPSPGPGEVLIKVSHAGVNFIDTYHREGIYPLPLPLRLGLEGSGTVVESGATSPSDFEPGTRVAWAMAGGSYAEYLVAPASALLKVPDAISFETAAALPLQGMTAHFLTHDSYPIAAGDDILVHAAAGGVGQLITQIAVARGARVIATVSTDAKAAIARSNGASDVIRYDQESVKEKVLEFTDGVGVSAVYDGVGRDTFDDSLASLRRRGTLVIFGGASGQVPPFDVQRLNTGGSLSVTRPSLKDFIANRAELQARANAVFELATRGALRFNVTEIYALSDVRAAHDALEGRQTTGKVLLRAH